MQESEINAFNARELYNDRGRTGLTLKMFQEIETRGKLEIKRYFEKSIQS